MYRIILWHCIISDTACAVSGLQATLRMSIKKGENRTVALLLFLPYSTDTDRQQDELLKTFFQSSTIQTTSVHNIFLQNPHTHHLHAPPTHSFHILLINGNESSNSNSHVRTRCTGSSQHSFRRNPPQQPSTSASQSSSVEPLRPRDRRKVLLVRFRDRGSQLRSSAGRGRRVRQD